MVIKMLANCQDKSLSMILGYEYENIINQLQIRDGIKVNVTSLTSARDVTL